VSAIRVFELPQRHQLLDNEEKVARAPAGKTKSSANANLDGRRPGFLLKARLADTSGVGSSEP